MRTHRLDSRLRAHGGCHQGSLLLEAVLAIGVFGIFLAGIGLSLALGEYTTARGGDRSRAAYLAEEQLDALREMRERGFSNVITGAHGLKLTSSGWAFSGTSVTNNGFTKQVVVSSLGTDWLGVKSTVKWNFGKTRSGNVVLNSYITDWHKADVVGNWSAMSRVANVAGSGTPDFQDIAVSGNYAYLIGTTISGGKGLYIYDISTPTSPTRVASTFDLGASAYGLAISGDRLYLATDSATQEVQVYDISSPTTLASGNLVNSYDLAGSGKARSIAVYGSNAYVGSLTDSPNPEFNVLLMSETGPMTLQSSLSTSGSILDMSLKDGYAYIANSSNSAEFSVIDIFDPENVTWAPGNGIDLTDVQDGNAMATTGTAALLGRKNGSSIDELILYSTEDSAVPAPPPGPWTLEVGGDVNALSIIAGSKYGFVGGSASSAQLKVLDLLKMEQSAAPVVKTYDAGATMKGIFYDWTRDRLFTVTASNLMVFAPG